MVLAVGSLNDVKLLWCDLHWLYHRKCAAVKGAIGKANSAFQRYQYFLFESLIIHIAADLCIPLWGTLLWTQEEIIHVEHIAVIDLCQLPGKGGFACGAVTVDSDDDLLFL